MGNDTQQNKAAGLSPFARGVIATTIESFQALKQRQAIAAARRAPHVPYGGHEHALGAEAWVDMKEVHGG